MSRVRRTVPKNLTRLTRICEALKHHMDVEMRDAIGPLARLIPHDDIRWLSDGVERFAVGDAKSLEDALGLKLPRGRPPGGYQRANLVRAVDAQRLRAQGMKLRDVAEKVFEDAPDSVSEQYIQQLTRRFAVRIEEERCRSIAEELRKRQDARIHPPIRRPPRWNRVRVCGVWVDPDREIDLAQFVRKSRKARKARSRVRSNSTQIR